MSVMNRSSRLSNLLFSFLGAASVALVVGVLAIAGVFGGHTERLVREVPRTTPVANQPAADGSVADIYAQTAPGVAFIENDGNGASGSGFLIDGKGHVVTNDHVVEGGSKFTLRFGESEDELPARLVGKDASSDLAVLEVDPGKLAETKPLELASSSDLRPGDAAIAIGSPFGLEGSVTTGVISALGRDIDAPNGFNITGVLQTDAAINPGNSGGPLLDADGRVIGINSQIATNGSDSNSGVGFAVPIDTVRRVVPQLKAHGKIDRAYLGVSSVASPDHDGAVVDTVSPGGPAASTALRSGDKIVAIDGKPISSPSDLGNLVLTKKPGDTVKLKVQSGSDTRTIDVKLGERPNTQINP
jgi:S1-C subfamily serine protease